MVHLAVLLVLSAPLSVEVFQRLKVEPTRNATTMHKRSLLKMALDGELRMRKRQVYILSTRWVLRLLASLRSLDTVAISESLTRLTPLVKELIELLKQR
nr:hypothetical protein PTVJELPE_PTVJELPE_CDS_0008 [Cressdnaviricota sp.]